MTADDRPASEPIRVFVTYEALAKIDPSQVRDLPGAFAIFDANRSKIDATANNRHDAMAPTTVVSIRDSQS
jgi:hypothetical protein